jgi:NAD(P)H dehydrogenase (quinone)
VYRLAQASRKESTIISMYNVFMHWGAIIVPPGYTDPVLFESGGNPYDVSSTDPEDGNGPSEQELAARYQGRRIAEKAAILAGARV